MKIQPRDLEILEACLKYGTLSTTQIGDLFFKNLHPTTALRRLKILEKEKLLNRMDSLPNHQSAWSLAIEGARLLRVEAPGRFTNRNATLHDVTVSGVRMVLERFGLCADFSTEMELKKRINWQLSEKEKTSLQIPDGLFMAQSKSKETLVVALEVELHAKSHARYRRIIRNYLDKDSIQFVWYFVKSKSIAKTIHALLQRYKRENSYPIFLFSWIDQANQRSKELEVYSSKTGKPVLITDLFDLPGLVENENQTPADLQGSEEEAA